MSTCPQPTVKAGRTSEARWVTWSCMCPLRGRWGAGTKRSWQDLHGNGLGAPSRSWVSEGGGSQLRGHSRAATPTPVPEPLRSQQGTKLARGRGGLANLTGGLVYSPGPSPFSGDARVGGFTDRDCGWGEVPGVRESRSWDGPFQTEEALEAPGL